MKGNDAEGNVARNFVADYFRGTRTNIAENISKGKNRVLDVGCGAGLFGAYLKQHGYADHVTGIEINQDAADEAKNNIDEVYCVDLNRLNINDILDSSNQQFDYITCNDVLEHLIDPWQVLNALAKKLSPNGKIIASIPNVRHWSVWWSLLMKGEWVYQDSGIMDRTHLRFFTKKTMYQLFESANLNVAHVRPLIGGKWKLVDRFSLRFFRDFIAVQWILIGISSTESKK